MKKKTPIEFFEELQNKQPNLILLSQYIGADKLIKCQCKICGYIWETKAGVLVQSKPTGCPVCCVPSRVVLRGYNDMWTTNPRLSSMLLNPDDGYTHTQKSNQKVDWKCPECGSIIRQRTINDVCQQGLSCSSCSDGYSFPERILYNLLNHLHVNFKPQKVFAWSCGKRYDFYIENLKLLCEINGEQHYKDKRMGFITLKEEKENDLFKQQIAIQNGIENYVIINAESSEFNYIKDSILNSEFTKWFDLTNVDWQDIYKKSINSFVISVINMWNEGIRSTLKIAENTKLCRLTVTRYLHIGRKLGLCDYDPIKAFQERDKNVPTQSVICLTTGEIFKSVKEAVLKHKSWNVSACCRGIRNYAGKLSDGTPLKWKYFNGEKEVCHEYAI
jgi:rubredoxin